MALPDYRPDPVAFVEEALQVTLLPWQVALIVKMMSGPERVERIMVRRVRRCMADGLHLLGGCRSCGVKPPT